MLKLSYFICPCRWNAEISEAEHLFYVSVAMFVNEYYQFIFPTAVYGNRFKW